MRILAENAEAECAAIADRIINGDWTVPIQQVIPVVVQGTRDNFNSGADPDNITWAPRKSIGDGHPLLMDRGTMLQAATGGGPGHVQRLFPTELQFGVDLQVVPYARAQNLGFRPRNLPKREYLGLRSNRLDECQEILGTEIETIAFPVSGS